LSGHQPHVAIDVPGQFPLPRADTKLFVAPARAIFNFSSENALAEKISVRVLTGIGIANREIAFEDNFVLPSWQIFSADVRLPFAQQQ
jgi:hypothetical protein